MTLVLAAIGPESIWLMADRRLSCQGRAPKDDGCKVMILESDDGVGILGYAGLGATARGTELATWMSAVLRGRKLPLEKALGTLASVMQKELPAHMIRMPRATTPSHGVIVPAFVAGEPRLYTINMALIHNRSHVELRYNRVDLRRPSRRFAVGGSGALYLMRRKTWMRPLLRMIKAHDSGQVSAGAVAGCFARLNNEVHHGLTDKSVGPRCVVVWQSRRGGRHTAGGEHWAYSGSTRDANNGFIPTIAGGMDVTALTKAIMPLMMQKLEALRAGKPHELEADTWNAAVAQLPEKPNEKLT